MFASKYPGGPAIHAETVCQDPVTRTSKENLGACNGYNGPDFRSILPKYRTACKGHWKIFD